MCWEYLSLVANRYHVRNVDHECVNVDVQAGGGGQANARCRFQEIALRVRKLSRKLERKQQVAHQIYLSGVEDSL